jgi:hypothetical protein
VGLPKEVLGRLGPSEPPHRRAAAAPVVGTRATGNGTGTKHIEALIDQSGDITVWNIHGVGCAATAADGHNTWPCLSAATTRR